MFSFWDKRSRLDLKTLRIIFYSLCPIGILVCVYSFLYVLFFLPHGYFPLVKSFIAEPILLGFFTFFGIICRHIYVGLERTKKNKINIVQVFLKAFKSKSLWMSVIICPVVLISVFKGLERMPDDLLAYLFAYQNGFFFESILGLKK